MSYINTLSPQAKKNAEILVKRLNAKGITNPNAQAGILAIVSKESGFIPRGEISYRNTSNARIRQIFGSRVAGLSESQLTTLKANDIAFFDQVYGSQWDKTLGFGNNNVGDGWKYRGNGLNQITGKSQFTKYAKLTGIDLVNKPELMNDIGVASDVLIEYFKGRFSASNNKLSAYNSTGLNDFKNVTDSVGAFYHANAGWGKDLATIQKDATGGREKALQRSPDLLEYVKQFTGQTIDLAKKK
jgi:predicted chitinase